MGRGTNRQASKAALLKAAPFADQCVGSFLLPNRLLTRMSEQDVDGNSAVSDEGEAAEDGAVSEETDKEVESAGESSEREKTAADSEDNSGQEEDELNESESTDDGDKKAEPSEHADGTHEDADESESLDEIAEEPETDSEGLDALLSEEMTLFESVSSEDDSADEPDRQLVEAIENAPAETVAEVITTVRTTRAQLADQLSEADEQIDDLESRLARKQADFQNYKQRQKREQKRIKEQATEEFVTRILDVRDNLARALEQDEDVDIRSGVESTLSQFDQQLERENVSRIEPDPGGDVDPRRHEVLATIASAEPEDTIATVHRPGYEMGEKVLRPAQVAVSDGSQHEPAADEQKEQQ